MMQISCVRMYKTVEIILRANTIEHMYSWQPSEHKITDATNITGKHIIETNDEHALRLADIHRLDSGSVQCHHLWFGEDLSLPGWTSRSQRLKGLNDKTVFKLNLQRETGPHNLNHSCKAVIFTLLQSIGFHIYVPLIKL